MTTGNPLRTRTTTRGATLIADELALEELSDATRDRTRLSAAAAALTRAVRAATAALAIVAAAALPSPVSAPPVAPPPVVAAGRQHQGDLLLNLHARNSRMSAPTSAAANGFWRATFTRIAEGGVGRYLPAQAWTVRVEGIKTGVYGGIMVHLELASIVPILWPAGTLILSPLP
jgi:hypothetical protein